MNLRKNKRDEGGAETSALNDILFILLFFFLIVATLANPNVIKLSIPKAASQDRAKQTIVVSIDATQAFYVNTKPVQADVLQSTIAEVLHENEEAQPTIVINADKQATADNIVAVMRAAHALKVRTVLAVDKE
ncbi:MAG TPA: biopolymer transporter ExbD [Edaphocola sp.]|nr:biopolymer transporter ExbD [Edaphocola sp.]